MTQIEYRFLDKVVAYIHCEPLAHDFGLYGGSL